MDAKKVAKDNLIYSTITGSTAYGTNLPTSDTDIRHLFCLPKELRENPFLNIENVQDKEQDDAEYDELKKFLILVTNANPNKIELLFTNPEHHLFVHPAMQPLLENRDLFLTKRIRHTFGGYAFSQKARMERHLRWIQKLEHKTERERYKEAPKLVRYILWVDDEGMEHSLKDFSNEELISEFFSKVFATKVNNALYKLYLKNDQVPSVFFSDVNCENPSFIDISLQRLQELKPEYKGFAYINFEAYQTDLKEYNHYLEWRQNRNKDRASLEVSHGYDTKHAMHCVRLLRMAKEILLEGKVIVKRPDAQELIGIRQGSMTLQEIFAYMQEMEQNLQIWHDKSPLPKTADQVKIAKAYQECLGIFYASLKK